MRKWQNRWRLKIEDLETGKHVQGTYIPDFENHVGGQWMRIFKDAARAIAERNPRFTGETLRVIFYLIGAVKVRNELPRPVKVAKAIGLHPSAVYRSYAQLVEAGFIWKPERGNYRFSPLFGWDGNAKDRDQALQDELAALRVPLLEEPTKSIRETRTTYRTRGLQRGGV